MFTTLFVICRKICYYIKILQSGDFKSGEPMRINTGDVVQIIGATDKKGNYCIAVGTVTEIGEEVTLEKVVTFSPKGFRLPANSLKEPKSNNSNEYSENELSRVSPAEPLYEIYKRSSL